MLSSNVSSGGLFCDEHADDDDDNGRDLKKEAAQQGLRVAETRTYFGMWKAAALEVVVEILMPPRAIKRRDLDMMDLIVILKF